LIQYSTWYIFFVFSSDLKLLYGPDQFEEKDPNEAKALAIFFNRLLLSSTLGAITGVVWVITQRARLALGIFHNYYCFLICFVVISFNQFIACSTSNNVFLFPACCFVCFVFCSLFQFVSFGHLICKLFVFSGEII
jgi:hypothetical protein